MSRQYRPGDAYIKSFTTGATNADDLPVAAIKRNGVTDGAVVVTVVNDDPGEYHAACTIPTTYVIGDTVELLIIATLDGVPDKVIYDTVKLVAIPDPIQRGEPIPNFKFPMVNSTNHVGYQPGLTVTAQRVLDDGPIEPCENPVVAVGGGIYRIDLTAADGDGLNCMYVFTATGADPRSITMQRQ